MITANSPEDHDLMVCSPRFPPEVANDSQRMGFRSSKSLHTSCNEAGP